MPDPDPGPALRGGGPPRSPRNASYKIDATLDAAQHRITATQTLTWRNTGKTAVTSLPFHLYLNAFKNEQSLFMRSSRGTMRGANATATGWGWIDVESVQIGGVELISKLVDADPRDPDETVAELALPAPVEPDAAIDVTMKFTAQLPEVFARSGYKGEFHLVAQWFPKVGVRVGPEGAERWECQPYHANTEFFADFGVYDVALTVPNTYTVAATGMLQAVAEAPGNLHTYRYHAEDVHDFAWMADPYMEVLRGTAKVEDGTVQVRVVHRPAQAHFAQRHLDAAIGAIEHFSAMFLPYPWPIMTIVDPPPEAMFGAGGMEYPTFVTTGGDTVFARPGVRLPEMITIHEVGHNWFQGILASNEVLEAWLDEGVNDWADARVMTDLYGARTSGIDWMGWHAEITAVRRAVGAEPGSVPSPIATAAHAFADSAAYADATYLTASLALRTLEQHVGPKRFAAAMKTYAKTFAFRHPTGRDLFETLSKELGQDLSWFFGPVFHDVGGMTLAIRTAACRKQHAPRGVFDDKGAKKIVTEHEAPDTGTFVCEVVVTNTGTMHAPVDIALEFADGSTQRLRWDHRGNGHWERFVVERSSPLAGVWLDPDGKLALASPVEHHYRIEGDGAASLRAAAWFAWGAQTLMQVVGP